MSALKRRWLRLVFISGVSCGLLLPALISPRVGPARGGAVVLAGEAGARQKGEKKPPPPAEPTITLGPHGVSVHAVGVYAHTLFERLAVKTGLQLIVDDTIKERKVTVNLTCQSPSQMIEQIVSAYGLSCAEVNGVTMISEGIPRKPSSYLLSDIAAVRTQYVPATEAKSLLPVFLQDHVKVNREQNSVILSAPTEVLRKFRQDIEQFDIPAAQILLQVLVVEFSENAAQEFDLGFTRNISAQGASTQASTGEIVLRGITDLPNEFQARLHALVVKGKARVRAAPQVSTVSGTQAEVFVGIQRYLRTPIEVESQWGSSQVNYIDAGVRLKMTPWTGGGGEIITDISSEVSTLSALDPITGLPDKSTRTAQTVVRAQDGQTIIIGGLLQQELHEVRTRIPVLGDLPLLGGLFRSKNIQQTQTELWIFITPRILSQTGHLGAAEEEQLRQRFLERGGDQPAPPEMTPQPPDTGPPSDSTH